MFTHRTSDRPRMVTLVVFSTVLLGLASSGCAGSSNGGSATIAAPKLPPSSSSPPTLSLVVIGDSIPYNSPEDCPGCTGFVDRYAKAAQKAIGTPVTVTNLSQHTGLTLPGLLAELGQFHAQLAKADVIIVGIAHNSNELNADRPCGSPVDADDLPDWSRMTSRCAMASADRYRPQYDRLYAQIARWRKGKQTILRTIDRYNDFTGAPGLPQTTPDNLKVKMFLDTWNTTLCKSARASGFGCADIYHALNGPNGLTPSGDLLGADYTHPSDKGNAVIANVLIGMKFAPLA